MLRYLTKAKKEVRRQKNGDAVNAIYDRAKMTIPAEYLICHQPDSPAYSEGARGNPPKLISAVARRYRNSSPVLGADALRGRFTDLRGVPYEVTESGAIVRVKVNVPA
jgi:hypothetical protein